MNGFGNLNVLKLIILGDGGVGKTAMTIQFLQNHFIEMYDPTIEDSYRKQIVIDNKPYFLEILNTAGQEEYTAMRDSYMKSGDGFIIVYDITNRQSFNGVESIKELIYMNYPDKKYIPIVICGNKSDLNQKRVVSTAEGIALSQKLDCKFFECSAKNFENIEQIWFCLVREIERLRTPKIKRNDVAKQRTAGGSRDKVVSQVIEQKKFVKNLRSSIDKNFCQIL